MASIELYKSKINSMSNYISQAKSAVSDFCVDLSALKKKILGINSSVCDNVVTSISSSSKTQEQQIEGLEATQKEVNAFIDLTINRDNSASSEIAKQKKEFYKKYSYLKPECEKSKWEKFCDGLKKVGEWCKDHWKLIVTVVICIAAIALICTGVGGILGAAALGALMGALSGGLIGGITSVLSGGSFLEGFENGAFEGAITGAIMGGLGGAGALFGKTVSCASKLGKAIKMTAKITNGISTVMGGFDTLAMGLGMIDPNNPITALNNKLHSSKLYNGFQTGVSMVAAFTGGASSTMACFIAGTMINTVTGLVAIEHLVKGDKIIAADPDTFEVGEKTILDTFERKVDKLVHLTINGEKIVTTDNHPFYVQGRGFIQAGSLFVGDKLISVEGKDLIVESHEIEKVDEPVTVYNFKVEDYHTYFVGEKAVWVHNDDCTKAQVLDDNKAKGKKAQDERHAELLKDHPDTQQEVTIRPYDENGNLVDYNVRVDEINNEFFNEVKASETAPYTTNQRKGYELLQKYGGEIRGKGKPGFEGGTKLPPTPGYTTRNGVTVPLSQDLAAHGGSL
ncbi:MAG: HINT domain-containing protein [Ruminococcus sp.]|uniref:polymorphic toxin-type HINT domain-containing protein n=1 Tax=Ruminococcus sp. TaxID=41978 RepID=UPI0025FBE485|nr:polymorphic toxin-type HINT domain-containing protein [Ruminococcus sp.]MCR5599336.1 HINT domain-containing protein [Ruminococcus sp.]